jgi:hypothetical protein
MNKRFLSATPLQIDGKTIKFGYYTKNGVLFEKKRTNLWGQIHYPPLRAENHFIVGELTSLSRIDRRKTASEQKF